MFWISNIWCFSLGFREALGVEFGNFPSILTFWTFQSAFPCKFSGLYPVLGCHLWKIHVRIRKIGKFRPQNLPWFINFFHLNWISWLQSVFHISQEHFVIDFHFPLNQKRENSSITHFENFHRPRDFLVSLHMTCAYKKHVCAVFIWNVLKKFPLIWKWFFSFFFSWEYIKKLSNLLLIFFSLKNQGFFSVF